MDSIADAIVYAAAYIGCREESEDSDQEDGSAIGWRRRVGRCMSTAWSRHVHQP